MKPGEGREGSRGPFDATVPPVASFTPQKCGEPGSGITTATRCAGMVSPVSTRRNQARHLKARAPRGRGLPRPHRARQPHLG